MSKPNPETIDLPIARPRASHDNMLTAARGAGDAAERAAVSARCLSAAIWSDELIWADRMAATHGWREADADLLIARLKARHLQTWGVHAKCD